MSEAPSGRAEALISRLHARYPRLIDLSLDRLRRVLAALGNPHDRLPPVIHVAGTNGKGSVCAFLRAMGEAQGWRVLVVWECELGQGAAWLARVRRGVGRCDSVTV